MFEQKNKLIICNHTLRKLERLIEIKKARGDLCQGTMEIVSALIDAELRKEIRFGETK